MSKLMIKATLGNDIRRVSIHNEELTYDELILMLQRVFRGKLSNDDEILLKYKDEDGDLITIFDSADLAFALEISPVLKLTLLVNGAEQEEEKEIGALFASKSGSVASIKNELRQIRDRVNKLLDYLEDNTTSGGSDKKVEEDKGNTESSINGKDESNAVNGEQSKEFDPLQGKPSAEEIQPPTTTTQATNPSSIVAPPPLPIDNKGPPTSMTPNKPPLSMEKQMALQQQYQQPMLPKPLHTSAYPPHPSMMPVSMVGPPTSTNTSATLPPLPPTSVNPTTSTPGGIGPPPTGTTPGAMPMHRVPTSSVYPPPAGMVHGMQPGQTPGGQVPGYNPYYKGVPSAAYNIPQPQPGYK